MQKDKKTIILEEEMYMPKINEQTIQELFEKAKAVRKNAYAPYSNFQVGAAILTSDGETFVGCNVENVSYRLTQCAEGAAITAMVAAGKKNIAAILVMGPRGIEATPCGACRQMLIEFAKSDLPVYLADEDKILETVTIKDLLPKSFTPTLLTKNDQNK